MVVMEPGDEVQRVQDMELVGGDIALELVNTASKRIDAGPPLKDRLRDYTDLVAWAERVELVSAERGARLRRAAARSPEDAETALERARELREVVYRVFASEHPAREDVAALGAAAAAGSAERRLVEGDDGFTFGWPESDALEQILWPVSLSAAELLTSDDRRRVKECASENCSWLFLDMSRNRSRRWCDMKECGNRAKARRFYARQKRNEA